MPRHDPIRLAPLDPALILMLIFGPLSDALDWFLRRIEIRRRARRRARWRAAQAARITPATDR